MTPNELAAQCGEAINKGLENVQLVLPRRGTGRHRMRVFGGKGQKSIFGEVACENADGNTVVWVNAIELLAYLAAAGLVVVKDPNGEVIS